ncbi:protein I'm not dead yet-like [Uranotaenia lowii]|uniref:protein I'm not dead yet-like n=1 Tax=Uranotaenia lowii TaxID=190385 RepID=UPI002479C608|nr:protein I'm not dead yet-like [Uranotaenia lowii]
MTCCSRLGGFIAVYWRTFVLIIVPLVASLVFHFDTDPAYRCMFVVIVMAIYWITQALPLPVTSLLPVVLFPLMGILDTDRTCMMYMKETIVMLICGIILALAVESCNLHKRIALVVIQIVGCSHRKLFFGLTLVTMFISMWTANTAACAMMSPVTKAVLEELESQGLCKMWLTNSDKEGEQKERLPSKITICYFAGAAYAANLGGCGTLIGTGTNLTFKGIYETRFPTENIDFLRFMVFNVPPMIISNILIYFYLQIVFMGMFRPGSSAAKDAYIDEQGETIARNVIRGKYEELGTITIHEITVAILFLVSVLLFFTRRPGFTTGWADVLSEVSIKDGTPAVLVVILMFVLPEKWTWLNYFKRNPDNLPTESSPGVITWKYINDKTPWGLVFLLGGGFALAEAGKVSGMSLMLGQSLIVLENLNPLVILLIVCVAAQVFTEFSANVAICNILLPVLAEMAIAIKIHPLQLMLPAAISCSYAFMLPVGTPAVAFVAGLGNIQSKDLMIAGIGPKIITIMVIWIAFPIWGLVIYPEAADFPDWAKENETETWRRFSMLFDPYTMFE